MSKYRVTKKEMKEKWGRNLVYIPDGSMQIFHRIISPVAYSTRTEGWACDYYEFSDFCISEGYDPAGKRIMSYEDFRPYRESYDNIVGNYNLSYDDTIAKIKALLADFVGDIKGRLNI